MNKQLPREIEIEKALLGCMIVDPLVIDKVRLEVGDFYEKDNFLIFRALKALKSSGRDIDLLLLKEFAEKKGFLKQIGGMTGLIELTESINLIKTWKDYLDVIIEKSNRRKIITYARKIEKLGFEESEDLENVLNKVKGFSKNVFDLKEEKGEGVIDLANKFEELQNRFKKYKGLGFPGPYPLLNKHTGGMIPGTVTTVVAYSNQGKSSFAYSYIPFLLKDNKKVLFLSNEVMNDILFSNILRCFYNKNIYEIMNANFEYDLGDFENFKSYDNVFNLEEIKIVIENSDADVVFIDFIQNIKTEYKDEYGAMTSVGVELQRLAIKTGKHLINLSQATNESRFKSGNGLQPKGSGAIFASSDLILGISNNNGKTANLTIIKNKYGPANIDFLMNVDFSKLQFKIFEEVHEEKEKKIKTFKL